MRPASPPARTAACMRSAGLMGGQQLPSMPPPRALSGLEVLFMSWPSGELQTLSLQTSIWGLEIPRKLQRVMVGGGAATAVADGKPAAAAAGDGIVGTGLIAPRSCAQLLGARPASAASPPQKSFHFFIAQVLCFLAWVGSPPAACARSLGTCSGLSGNCRAAPASRRRSGLAPAAIREIRP